jgi:protein-disulfide isomerase
MESPKIAAKIAADQSLARSLAITGTPTVVVGTRPLCLSMSHICAEHGGEMAG